MRWNSPGKTWSWRGVLPLVIPVLAAGIGIALYSFERTGQPQRGTLHVASEPDGADVFIDGQLRGTTPATLHDLLSAKWAKALGPNA